MLEFWRCKERRVKDERLDFSSILQLQFFNDFYFDWLSQMEYKKDEEKWV